MQVYTSENQNDTIFNNINNLKNTAVALGGFDAIHAGHREIIRNVVDYAKVNNLTSVVYMFRNQPKAVLGAEERRNINTFRQRLEIVEALGADVVIAQWFTPEFKNVSAENFIKLYLRDWLDAKYIAVGFNYRFGKNREGNIDLLQKLGDKYGIRVCSIPSVNINGAPVSSTRIRNLIQNGKMEAAGDCLGRHFSIQGLVISGNRIGRTIGFPTANLNLPKTGVVPKYGVYISKTRAYNTWYPSITNVGSRPTVENGQYFIETYISGFDGDLYNADIEIRFYSYLRGIVKFSDLEELKAQLEKDKKNLKKYFE